MMQMHAGMTMDAATDMVKTSVELARKAIVDSKAQSDTPPRTIFIAGSVGPYATMLHDASEYSGHYVDTTDRRVRRFFLIEKSANFRQ